MRDQRPEVELVDSTGSQVLSTKCSVLSTRRKWLQTATAAIVAGMAGCRRRSGAMASRGGQELKVFNWSDYIDEEVIARFEREHECTVVYDNYASDSELETRLATGAGGYDVVFPSDRAMVALMEKKLLRPLEREHIANFRHLDPKFLSPPFDQGNQYSVPYFWGTLALGVRNDFIDEDVRGLEPLFDSRNKGRITMLDDMENVVAAALSHRGLPLNSVEPGHLAAAEKLLVEQRPLVQAYTSDSYRERLISGQAWAALGWSGDLLQADAALRESGIGNGEAGVRVIVPENGTMMWIDSMAIPRQAVNVLLAHAFINFLLEPSIGAKNAVKVNYATPNSGARELLPAAMLADESIYPPNDVLDRCTSLENRGEEIEKVERVWRVVRG